MTNFNQKLKNQEGVTLLLAVMILSALVLVTLAVAAFTIQEVRSSRAQSVSEPAIIAAESGAEQSLWQYKRGGTVADCSSPSTITMPSSNSAIAYCRTGAGDTFELDGGIPAKFYLYDPNNLDNVDLISYPYTYLSVTNQTPGVPVRVRITRLDGTPVGAQPVTVFYGSPQNINIPAVTAGNEGRMEISLDSSVDSKVDVTTNRGLPHIVTLDSSGCSSRSNVSSCSSTSQELFNRKVRVKIK